MAWRHLNDKQLDFIEKFLAKLNLNNPLFKKERYMIASINEELKIR